MLYLLCVVLPPVAVLLVGKPGQAALNLVLCCCVWIPGVVHAFMVVADSKAEKRTDRVVNALRGRR